MASACTNGPGYCGRGATSTPVMSRSGSRPRRPSAPQPTSTTRIPAVTPVRAKKRSWRRARARAASGRGQARAHAPAGGAVDVGHGPGRVRLSGSRAASRPAAAGRGAGCRRCAGGCSRARSRPGIELGLAGPVDPDVAAGGPVGQRRGLRAGAEGDGAVERAGVAPQAVADVEGARRRRGRRAPDRRPGRRNTARPLRSSVSGQARAIDDQPRVDRPRSRRAPSAAASPVCARRAGRRARIHSPPRASRARPRTSTRFVVPSGVRAASRATARAPRRRRRARDRRSPQRRPLHGVADRRAAAPARRSAGLRAPARGCRGAAAVRPVASLPARRSRRRRRRRRSQRRRRRSSGELRPLAGSSSAHDEVRARDDPGVPRARERLVERAARPAGLPASRRIHAAWRASTEWMASAGGEVLAAIGCAAPGPCRRPPPGPRTRPPCAGTHRSPRSRRRSRSAGA